MRKTIPVMLILILVISFNTYALTEDTHKAINEEIAKRNINGFSLDSYLVNQLGFSKGIKEELNETDAQGNSKNKQVYWWLGYGGEQEDRPGSILDYFQNKPTRSVNHFHNPLKHWSEAGLNEFLGFYTGQSSVLWSQNPNQHIGGKWSWQDARNYFYSALTSTNKTQRDEYFAKTFRAAGQLMHLVQDASVPEHVRNDAHVFPAYEAYVEKKRPTLWNNWINNPIFDKSILNIATVPSAPVPISRIIDTDFYNSQNPGITTNSKIGLSEYTNANFLSPDTMFTDDLSSDDRHYFPYPRAKGASLWADTSNILPRLYLKKTGEGEPVTHLAVVSLLYKYRDKYFPQYYLHIPVALDDECKKEYASKLIPRAVGYSAGLLNYFFRGDMDMVPDDATGSGYVIVNNTDEDMNGTFELYYDNNSDQRIRIKGWALSIGKKSSGNNKSTNITFTKPSDMKEDGKYMLVFRGKLGSEEDAVIGRQLELKGGEYVFLVSAAPYGKNDRDDRIFITVITMFKMNIANNKYELTSVDTFKIDGEMYFDGMKTTSLIINSNDAKNYHIINYTMDDEESNILWSEKLENYGAVTIDGSGYEKPPKGSYHAYLDAYLAYWKYPWTAWASGRRTSNVVWREYKGSFSGFRYTGGNYIEDTGKEWYLGPHLSPFIEGSPQVTRHEVIAGTEDKTIYIQRDSDISQEDSHFHCEYIDLLNRTIVYDYDLMRLVWSGQMKFFLGDILIKTLDYYGKGRWDSHAVFESILHGNCTDTYFDTYIKEYVITYPNGRSISAFVSDKIIDVIDYDNYNNDDLFILFYSIKDYRGYGYPIEYFLAYKTQKDSNFTEISIYKGLQGSDRLYGVSSQLNKDTIVYSYHIQHTSIPWPPMWKNEKFIIGVINIADKKLPLGHRQEFEYSPLEEHSSPMNVRLSPSTGGTLGSGTYSYYITAVNPCNQTLASSSPTITLGEHETAVKIEWGEVAGASHYIIYGRNGDTHALAIVGETMWNDTGIDLELKAAVLNFSIVTPWKLPESPIKPFLSAIGIHKKED